MNYLRFGRLSGTGEKMKHLNIQDISSALEGNPEVCPAAVRYVRESDFMTEAVFCEILSYERKRSERTKKKFFLLLMDIEAVGDEDARCGIVRHIARVLEGLEQPVPLKGWYKHRKVLGIMLSEAQETEKNHVRQKIVDDVPPAFRAPLKDMKFVTLSFPGGAEGNNDHRADALFYPELFKKERQRRLSSFLKRVVDIAGSLAAILLFAPVFIAVPLLIKAGSSGPVLFKQERIGRYGRKFEFLKFRTMSVDSDPTIHQEYIKKFILEKKSYNGGAAGVYKIKDDPRVTPIGRFLRKTSLDEFPQFFNVLKGDMSLVGPRPPIPYELENYDLWHLRRIMEIKPGITGLWQVQGRSSTTFDEMVRLDLKYAKEWSLWLDMKILLKTPRVVLTGKGAY